MCRDPINPHQLQALPRRSWNQLCALKLHCDFWGRGCQALVQLDQLSSHTSDCLFRDPSYKPPAVLTPVSQEAGPQTIVYPPVTQPLSKKEDRALGNYLQRKEHQLSTSGSVVLPIQTGGRPRQIAFIPSSSTAQPSERTMRRRQKVTRAVEEAMASTEELAQSQRAFNLQHSTAEEREQLLFQVG